MALFLMFGYCVFRIWHFFKHHKDLRANERSLYVKVFIAFIALGLRALIITEEVKVTHPGA